MSVTLAQFQNITSSAGLSSVEADELKSAYDATTAATAALAALAEAPEVEGARDDGTALANLLTALAGLGLITDSTTAGGE